jgi:hypothetical protein
MLNGFQSLGKYPHWLAGVRFGECGDEACGTLCWQGEQCHHGKFLHFNVIGKQEEENKENMNKVRWELPPSVQDNAPTYTLRTTMSCSQTN